MLKIIPFLLIFLLSGCTGVDFKTIPQLPLFLDQNGEIVFDETKAGKANIANIKKYKKLETENKGIWFLDTSPYLLIHSSGDGNIQS